MLAKYGVWVGWYMLYGIMMPNYANCSWACFFLVTAVHEH